MKPTNIKIDFLQIEHLTKSVNPSYIGTAVMILVAIFQKNYEAVKVLAPHSNPVVIKLQDLGWLDFNESFRPVLTEAGDKLVRSILVKAPGVKKISERSALVKSWITNWIKMWPPHQKQPSTGKKLIGDPKNLLKKMEWFVDEYDYTQEEIIMATREYLMYHHRNAWQTVRQATYFIFKEDGSKIRTSDLATWCEAVRNKGNEPESVNRLSKSIN